MPENFDAPSFFRAVEKARALYLSDEDLRMWRMLDAEPFWDWETPSQDHETENESGVFLNYIAQEDPHERKENP